ncbi:MAG: T9SS type A sorting domain-containing protein [Bacteroidota bacterium]
MKNKLLFLSFFVISLLSFGQCPTTFPDFTTQAQVDDFIIQYPDCTEIDGYLSITGNDITNLNGFSNITEIGFALMVSNADALVNFEGLNTVETIGWLMITNNDNLENFNGLENVTTIIYPAEGFDIINNSVLTDISGIENAVLDVINLPLYIQDNPNLAECSISNICTFLENGGGHLIFGNANGCNSETEISANCILGVPENQSGYEILVYPNPVSEKLTIQVSDAVVPRVEVYSLMGEKLVSTSEMVLDLSNMANGIYFVTVTTDRGTLVQKIVKE